MPNRRKKKLFAKKYRKVSLLLFAMMLLTTSVSMFALTDATTNPAIDASTGPASDVASPVTAAESEPSAIPESEPPVILESEPPVIPESEPPVIPESEPPVIPENQPPTTPESESPTTPGSEAENGTAGTTAASPMGTTSSTAPSYYKLWENWGGWWQDAEKSTWNFDDDDLCWAATASNVLAWAGWIHGSGMTTCDQAFAHFQAHWTDAAGHTTRGWEWWFDGTLPSYGAQVDVAGGGNFYPTLTVDDYYDWSGDNKTLLQQIDSRLQQGYGIGLGISKGEDVGHAITCWGVNYNPSYNPSDPDYTKYLGIWVTDSDDNKLDDLLLPWLGNAGIQNRLRYYTVDYSVSNEKWYFSGPGWFEYGGIFSPGWYIDDISWLAAGPGIAPKVDAGPDQTVDEGDAVFFGGTCVSPGPAPTKMWDFGDGSITSGSLSPSHTYSNPGGYTVTLTVTDPQGDWTTDTLTVTVEKVVPTAYAGSDQTVDEGATVSLSGSYSYSGTGTLTIVWAFGDGATAAGSLTPQHQYVDDGTYTVTLTIIDHDGDVGTDTLTITVNNVAPTLTLGGAGSTDEGAVYTLTLQATDPGTDTISAWGIDWGDGLSEIVLSNPTAVNHTYAEGPNSCIIRANATDEDGTHEAGDTLAVTVNNVAPTATISGTAQPNPYFILPIVHTLTFSGSFTDPGCYDTHTIEWDFGDGSPLVTGTLIAFYSYSAPGDYTVSFIVTDDDGGIGTDTVEVTVLTAKEASHVVNEYIQNLQDSVFKNNPSQRKNAFNNKFSAIDHKLDNGAYKDAADCLQNSIRGKTDGLIDGNPNNDWILDKKAQTAICMMLDDLIGYLRAL